MKKIFALILAALFCLSLCACGGGNSLLNQLRNELQNGGVQTDDNGRTADTLPADESRALALGEKNTVADYAEFTLFKVSTTKQVTASIGGGLYYEHDVPGETYVDVVLDWTNTSSETISNRELLVAYATGTGEYRSCLYAVETDNATDVSQFENVAPLSKIRLHCGISVPETETDVTVVLEIKGQKYTYEYTMGQTASNATPISVGQTVEAADFATMVFNGIEYTDDLMPSNTSGYYTHYPVDDPANTYLVVRFDITNYQTSDRECDTFLGVKAVYMDKYTYVGNVVVEDEDGAGFSGYEDIAPLTTRHFCYLIKVPKTVTENTVALTISFNGQEYTYTA
ncbi:MAG: hypothetical protein IJD17_04220 [Clostridia bacterium]|nr:hypothetical protein [Clostridia bacterium]